MCSSRSFHSTSAGVGLGPQQRPERTAVAPFMVSPRPSGNRRRSRSPGRPCYGRSRAWLGRTYASSTYAPKYAPLPLAATKNLLRWPVPRNHALHPPAQALGFIRRSRITLALFLPASVSASACLPAPWPLKAMTRLPAAATLGLGVLGLGKRTCLQAIQSCWQVKSALHLLRASSGSSWALCA